MYHFFAEKENIRGDIIVIQGEDVRHIKNVLRMHIGEEISVQSENKIYIAQIASISEEVEARIIGVEESHTELPAKIYLFQALPKADKLELIIQKAVELGVYAICPVETKRVITKLDHKKKATKTERWQAIAKAAAKQSKRALIPEIYDVMSFNQALDMAKDMPCKMIPYELSDDLESTKRILSKVGEGMDIAIFIGPEGGFEEDEIKRAREAGIEPISLGQRILRTETAGLSILSVIMMKLEGLIS